MDAMGSMMGGSMMGNPMMLFDLLAVLFVWVIGLAAVGALVFWAVRKLSEAQHYNG
jgi:predicted lipid-binding transport protein (Tim44 family)